VSTINIPAEWAPHRRIWTAWPSAADLWQENLEPARAEVAAMVKALAQSVVMKDGSTRQGDLVMVLANGASAAASAKKALGDDAIVVDAPFGDIWIRDTGPVFAFQGEIPVALRFQTNGWGGKYDLPFDDTIGDVIAEASGAHVQRQGFVLEGGAVDHDGEGTVLTTRQCVLNSNRNSGWNEGKVEALFAEALGARKVLWLGDGLVNDHTDGHVDNVARFVGPGIVACQSPWGDDDPNGEILVAIAEGLAAMKDASGRALMVKTIPSPGLITNEDGEAAPASHMNFIIGNASVVVPLYGSTSSDAALRAIAEIFPTHRVVGIQSKAVLTGGGSFHCITQQEPAFK
jgi:agmatine deiminase